MKQQNFLNNSNFFILIAPAAAVAIMTLILSRGNFIAAIGAGIGTAVSVYVTNYRLITKTKFLAEKTKDLIDLINGLETHPNSSQLERIEKTSVSSKEHSTSLDEDIESLKRKLAE